MIDRSDLEDAARNGDPLRALTILGYETDPVEIDLADWRRCGFDAGVYEPERLVHAGRRDHIELLIVDTASKPVEVIRRYRTFSREIRPVLIRPEEGALSFYTWAAGSVRQLRFDPEGYSSDSLARLASLAIAPGGASSLETRIEKAFSPADLEEQFLTRFRSVWKRSAAELTSFTEGDERVAESQALLILSRLLFLNYVQIKGWLDGDRAYLPARVSAMRSEVLHPIYGHFISPLFFECLNTPVDRRSASARAMGNLPYLNGGLFAKSSLEQKNPLSLSDEIVISAIEDCFDHFELTVNEREGHELAIDPEMLGRVFETLMRRDERGRTGSFYTPRRVVDEMTGETLCSWLAQSDSGLERVLRESPEELDRKRARVARSRLRKVRVIDPACGSGAFLMSALRKIEELSRRLGFVTGNRPFTRRSIVERSLYGVDLEPEAVQLCELRLWLSIAAGDPTERPSSVRPLPQLDRNILQGNSLLSDLDVMGDDPPRSQSWARSRRRHAELVRAYQNASPQERPKLRRKLRTSDKRLTINLLREACDDARRNIDRIASQQSALFAATRSSTALDEARTVLKQRRRLLERAERGKLDFFSWEVNFAHIGGRFDLVIGNPPWVRSSRLDPASRRMLADRYECARGGGAGVRQFDLAAVFVEKSLGLADQDARISLLVPSKILSSDYGIPVRRRVGRRHTLLSVTDLSKEEGLFSADTFPVSLLMAREHGITDNSLVNRNDHDSFTTTIDESGGPWLLIRPELRQIVDDLRERLPRLETVLGRRPLMGLKTGANRNFFVDVTTVAGPWMTLATGERVPVNRLARCARGRDVRRWKCAPSTWMIWPPAFEAGDETSEWLEEYLSNRNIDPDALAFSWFVPEHLGSKVVWKDVSAGMQAVVIPETISCGGNLHPLIPNQTLYLLDIASLDEGYAIAGLLNSTIGNLLASLPADQAKDGHRRYFARTVASIPMFNPDLDDTRVRDVVRISRAAHLNGGDGVTRELDRAVASCMGLSSRELGTMEKAIDELF